MDYTLAQNCWNGEEPVTIKLPEDWQVREVTTKNQQMRVLDKAAIQKKVDRPIGCASLKELGRGKGSACIIFDDLSRATPAQVLAEIVLEELLEAGVPQEGIIFVCALGMHGTHTRADFAKKLGEKIVRDYPVFNHNAFGNCTEVGTTAQGTKVLVNSAMMKCELKIGLGSIVPHTLVGFGGGSKIILPGVAHHTTIEENHKKSFDYIKKRKCPTIHLMGDLRNRAMREDSEEAARLAGLDFKIDVLLNPRNQVVDVFAGDPVEAFYTAAPVAMDVYGADPIEPVDVAIVNCNSKNTEAFLGSHIAKTVLKKGGDVVVINHCAAGQVPHYLCGYFGLDDYAPLTTVRPYDENVGKIIIYNPAKDYQSGKWFGTPEQIRWADTWEEVLRLLDRPAGTAAALIPDGTITYFKDPEKSFENYLREKETLDIHGMPIA